MVPTSINFTFPNIQIYMLVFRGNKKVEKDIEILHIDSVAMISKSPVETSKFKGVRNFTMGTLLGERQISLKYSSTATEKEKLPWQQHSLSNHFILRKRHA